MKTFIYTKASNTTPVLKIFRVKCERWQVQSHILYSKVCAVTVVNRGHCEAPGVLSGICLCCLCVQKKCVWCFTGFSRT